MFRSKKIMRKQSSNERAFNAHIGNHTSLYTKMQPLAFTPLLAKDIGINRAILLHQLQYWMNSMNSGKSIENVWNDPDTNRQIVTYRKWIRDSISEWHHILVYMSKRTIRRSLDTLIAKHIIMVSSKINRNKYNHTHWYSINYNALNHLFIKKHPQLAKSMHIFPEVKRIKKIPKSAKNSSSFKSLYTENHTNNGYSPHRYRCGHFGHIEPAKMATSNRPKWTHRTGQNGRILSNSSTNSSTNSSRSSVKKPNSTKKSRSRSNTESKSLNRSSTSDERKSKNKSIKRPTKSLAGQRHISTSLNSKASKSLGLHGQLPENNVLKMTTGEPTHAHDKHYLDEMQKAYRDTWQDDVSPSHSMRIYRCMKHWLAKYGGSTCVITLRRVTGYIRREIFYGDTAHSHKWRHKLTTTASRLRYIGRSLANAHRKNQQVQEEREENHDYKYSHMTIQQKMKIIHEKEDKRQSNPKLQEQNSKEADKLLKDAKDAKARRMRIRFKKEKEFAKKFDN